MQQRPIVTRDQAWKQKNVRNLREFNFVVAASSESIEHPQIAVTRATTVYHETQL
jgi:hypothetical protein